jgi:hypothetical protein
MARSFSTATLTVKLQENIVLGGQNMGSLNSFSVSGIKNVVKRLMTATTAGASILTFHNSEEAAGQYIEANVRYIRITNLDDTNHIYLTFKNEDNDEFIVLLDKGQSFIYNSNLDGGVVNTFDSKDTTSASTDQLGDLTNITAKADTASCDIEVYIATT